MVLEEKVSFITSAVPRTTKCNVILSDGSDVSETVTLLAVKKYGNRLRNVKVLFRIDTDEDARRLHRKKELIPH